MDPSEIIVWPVITFLKNPFHHDNYCPAIAKYIVCEQEQIDIFIQNFTQYEM